MEEQLEGVAFPPRAMGAAEGQMVRADLVREMVARRERGESTRQIARELAVDCSASTIFADRRQLFLPVVARLMFDRVLLCLTPS